MAKNKKLHNQLYAIVNDNSNLWAIPDRVNHVKESYWRSPDRGAKTWGTNSAVLLSSMLEPMSSALIPAFSLLSASTASIPPCLHLEDTDLLVLNNLLV